jgi:hypothetical protein
MTLAPTGTHHEQGTKVNNGECEAGKGAMHGEDLMGWSLGGCCMRDYATAASN